MFFLFSVCQGKSTVYSREKAAKVLRIIDDIQREQISGRFKTQKIVLSEEELNAYIAYRIESENEEVMKELSLHIFPGNLVEGKAFIDLRGQNLPRFLKPEMTLFFSTKLEIRDKKVRLVDRQMFLDGQKIHPMVIDAIIAFAAKIQNEKPTSLGDWYILPYGVKNIQTEKGKAVFLFQ